MQIRTSSPADATFVVRADSAAQRKVYAAMGLVGALVALGGLVSVAFDPKSPISWALTVVGLATLAHTAYEWRRQSTFPVLAVDAEAVWFRVGARHLVAVPWAQVTDVRSTQHGGFWFVCVDADEAAAELEREQPKLWARTAPSRSAHGTPFALTDSGKDVSRFKIFAALEAAKATADRPGGAADAH